MTTELSTQPSIVCPVCNMRSYNPGDISHGYCGMCHDFTFGTVLPAHEHTFVYVDDEYGSLAQGGSYEIWKCSNPDCNKVTYRALPD